jgi:hypothetical protein
MSFVTRYLENYARRRWRLDSLRGISTASSAQAFAPEGTTLWCVERGGWLTPRVPDDYPGIEWCYRLSQYYHGEVFAAAVYEHLLAEPGLDGPTRSLAESVYRDEQQHVEALRLYLTRRLSASVPTRLFAHGAAFKQVCDKALRCTSIRLKLATLHLVVEPSGVASMATSLKFVTDGECIEMLQRVLGDEAHHLQLASLHLADVAAPERTQLLDWLTLAVGGLRHSAIPRQAYALALPDQADALVERAEESAAIKSQARRTAIALVRACRGTALQESADALGLALRSPYQPDLIARFPES